MTEAKTEAKSHAIRVGPELVGRAQDIASKAVGEPTAASILRQAIALGLAKLESQGKRKARR